MTTRTRWIVLLVFYFQDSHGDNAYGPSPKAGAAPEAGPAPGAGTAPAT